jgi:hypothetical protein
VKLLLITAFVVQCGGQRQRWAQQGDVRTTPAEVRDEAVAYLADMDLLDVLART